jgi:hypothetical protein
VQSVRLGLPGSLSAGLVEIQVGRTWAGWAQLLQASGVPQYVIDRAATPTDDRYVAVGAYEVRALYDGQVNVRWTPER